MKNIVVCCDGTDNQLRGELTNVVRLYEILAKNAGQATFYDPGVGTLADPFARGPISSRWSIIKGLAFGDGLRDNVFDAYRYLMRTYREGDRVYLFGFSRGAFTARVLAGVLHHMGLLFDGSDNLLPYLWRSYRAISAPPKDAPRAGKDAEAEPAAEIKVFRCAFTRPCRVEFLGAWDTVSSVGLYNWNQHFAGTYWNPNIRIARHAIALDEKRAAYRANSIAPDDTPVPMGNGTAPRVMNVWFPGVHCDVGGGYPWPSESSLAMAAFEWLVREAQHAGLAIDTAKLAGLLTACPPKPPGDPHDSLRGLWKIVEYIPARRYDWNRKQTVWRWKPNKPRAMLAAHQPFLHQTVVDRMARKSDYLPPNLPSPLPPVAGTRPAPVSPPNLMPSKYILQLDPSLQITPAQFSQAWRSLPECDDAAEIHVPQPVFGMGVTLATLGLVPIATSLASGLIMELVKRAIAKADSKKSEPKAAADNPSIIVQADAGVEVTLEPLPDGGQRIIVRRVDS